MADIEKRGSKYLARVSYKEKGKYKRKSKGGFTTKSAAKTWIKQQEADKTTSKFTVDSKQLFPDYFKSWYELYKTDASDAQQRWYKFAYHVYSERLNNVTLAKLTRPILQRFLNGLAKDYAFSTVKKLKTYMVQAIKGALYDNLISTDPTIGLTYTGKDGKNRELKFLEEPQMKALIEYLTTIPVFERSVSDMMIIMALNTGARYEEVAALTWGDLINSSISINKAWDQVSRKIKETKNKSSNRVISVPSNLIIDLKAWSPIHANNDFVFCNDETGLPQTSNAANKKLQKVLIKIKSPKRITFHGLRHTHASWLLSNGVDVKYVSERLGHSSITMTLDIYTHLLQKTRTNEEQKSISLLSQL
ncbi:site-specific integrase [Weissella paramesenteroides]|uniref:site-specific integrase n=1 Tax=Weissella paramesenteroides TaxID=1249 RepID=UPI00123C51C2|nr:site-specific integrase [Weissella paramesenteroides]KAA8455280.1 site-specific integrase [Weissella paramesenteroides]KAA8456259.1 site-specific integrase [Weissella paramesenteroides]KAA8458250.1 site-specific integrase [Weissella paramesenteroides]KAA8460241.1 site-specific integrase [Weissella paramesenteroides]KAA8461583.1 site-specific integrase [Weissella paramesenteroides]